ncbi:MAG: phage head-tail connector protein [Eubacterium sp.]
MEERILNQLASYPGINNLDKVLLKTLVTDAIEETKSYINYDAMTEIPKQYDYIVREIVLIKVNKLGVEGIVATSQSGISETYIEDLPASLRRQLRRIRKLPRGIKK